MINEVEPKLQTSKFCPHLIHCFEKYRWKGLGFVSKQMGFVHTKDIFSNCSLKLVPKCPQVREIIDCRFKVHPKLKMGDSAPQSLFCLIAESVGGAEWLISSWRVTSHCFGWWVWCIRKCVCELSLLAKHKHPSVSSLELSVLHNS